MQVTEDHSAPVQRIDRLFDGTADPEGPDRVLGDFRLVRP